MLTGKKIKINFFFWLGVQFGLLSLLLIFMVLAPVTKHDKNNFAIKPAGNLVEISRRLDKSAFNGDKNIIKESDFIYPVQKLIIPVSVSLSERFVYSPFQGFDLKKRKDKSDMISGTIKY